MGIFWVGIFRGEFSRGEFDGWEFPGGDFPRTNNYNLFLFSLGVSSDGKDKATGS